jgi:site-specific recombinase XerD
VPTYHDAQKARHIAKLKALQTELPRFTAEFFRGLNDYTSARTRLGYGYDLRLFFTFLSEECKRFTDTAPTDFTLEHLARLTADDIEEFMDDLAYYIKHNETDDEGIVIQNEAKGKSRKLAAVRTMFKYFYGKGKLPANPAELVGFPKLRERPITTLEVNEVAKLLDAVEDGAQMTGHQKAFHELTKLRDLALITLLLGTGMRVSECVGLNLTDLDFDMNACRVTRKGGDTVILYFNDEVADALIAYLETRENVKTAPGHEQALFLSLQNRRITDRAVQNLVKKYAARVTTLKNISPHKLRSTFGTQLYNETHDIYLVANVLGHADVNTTRKHYAKMDEEQRRRAASAVKLRKS